MRRQLCVVALVLIAGAACGGTETAVSSTTPPAARTSVEGRAPTIRMEIPLAPDMPDLPRLLTRDALRAMGYTVETATYGDNVITIQAMVQGKLDFARIPMPQVLAAIQQGAPVTVIVGGGDSSRMIATAPEIKQCSDLNNKQVSVPNLISAQTLALRRYLATRCPGTNVELVVIAGVENRLAALLANRTGGAILEANNMFELQRVYGSKFNVLSDLALEFPGVNGAAVVAPRAFVDKFPVTAREIVREMVLAVRRLQDPAFLRNAMANYLAMNPDDAERVGKLYLERKNWDLNGGLSDALLTTNIDFFVEAGVIKPGLTPALVTDRSYLTAALDEIGRK